MKRFKKAGTLSLAAVLSSGILATGVSAETPTHELQESNKVKIQVLESDSTILKQDVIKRFKQLFPGDFDDLNDSDFHMRQMLYPEDDAMRYELDFNKDESGGHVYGYASFVGEDLQLESFHFEPGNIKEATFPPKVEKDEAEQIAVDFMEKLSGDGKYELVEGNFNYWGNQTLLEPIRYSFSFARQNNGVPVSGQNGEVTVLGNGQVVQYYNSSAKGESYTYDDPANVQDEKSIQEKVKHNLSVGLEYQMDFEHRTGEPKVSLVYSPSDGVEGVHAISGDWQTADGFIKNPPNEKGTYFITEAALEPRSSDVSIEQAKAFAEEFLAVDSKDVTLVIQSIDERENYTGQKVISIDYMYEYKNGGMGTNLEIDKETGEIVHYHDMRSELMTHMADDKADNSDPISKDEALKQAVSYLKEYSPSILHHYAMPTTGTYFEEAVNAYYFSFPRVVNGIPVSGDQIGVSIAVDGGLQSLTVNQFEVENWPSPEDVISEDEALKTFKDALSMDLTYVQADKEQKTHYSLVYRPVFNESTYSFLNATTGEWTAIRDDQNGHPIVQHPIAEEELNFLIAAGILKMDDGQALDADADISKGKAIETMMRSLRPFYEEYIPEMGEQKQSFENIDIAHPLYAVIEEAVSMGILDTDSPTFDIDSALTKEELAVWYIRGIGLEKAASISGIYKADFADADKVSDRNIGYVALADALDLVTAEDGNFNPEQEISYADLAVSIFKFAELYE